MLAGPPLPLRVGRAGHPLRIGSSPHAEQDVSGTTDLAAALTPCDNSARVTGKVPGYNPE